MIPRIVKKTTEYLRSMGGEAARYIIAGLLTTFINFAVFALMTKIFHIGVTVSNVTSISASILFAYVANKLYVFKNRCGTRRGLAAEFCKFVGSRLFTMALEVGTVLLFVEILRQDELLGKLFAQVLVIIANYVISKAIVFRKNRQ